MASARFAFEMEAPADACGASAGGGDSQGLGDLAVLECNGDMMARFEALSRAFKSEVEGLVDQEKATSRDTAEQLRARIDELEAVRKEQLQEAKGMAVALRDFVGRRQKSCLGRVFGEPTPPAEPAVASVADVRNMLGAFLEVNETRSPELEAALGETDELRCQVEARESQLEALRAELREARVLKTQEERDLVEFRSLREKESQLHEANLTTAQLRARVDELQSANAVLSARAAQSEAALGDKARRIVEMLRQLEEESEQRRLLSDENNTLRLQLGKDSEYAKVQSPDDPLAFKSAAGQLTEGLQREEQRFTDELAVMQCKFPGLLAASGNCRGWCSAQLSRHCGLYNSFLHLFQDSRQCDPAGIEIQFVSKTKEVDVAWSQREEEMREQDAAFQEQEKSTNAVWEKKRLALVAERDAKIKQLLEHAENSKTKAEKQLLMQQAKLFGQRLDAQIERLWAEQKKERDERWAAHSKAKQESRQRFKDESLSVQKEAEGVATASEKFHDMAQARLASVEDAWMRNAGKASTLNGATLKSGSVIECFKAAGHERPLLPREGAQHGGVSDTVDALEEVISGRMRTRQQLLRDLEEQSLKQLRTCVERFVHEGAPEGIVEAEIEQGPGCSRASAVLRVLQARQHRIVADTLQRQFHDYLLVLRLAALCAAHLLPTTCRGVKAKGARLDLPSVPREMREAANAGATESPQGDTAAGEVGDEATQGNDELAEERFLYEALLRRLLDRSLTTLNAKQREELLALKRASVREVRVAVESLCQLESVAVDKAIKADMDEYRSQVKCKLLSDCEYHLCEERNQLYGQVDHELELHAVTYQKQAAVDERAALRERRKWLSERLVVMVAKGAASSGDRAVLQRLRAELRACELRLEKREQELIADGGELDAACSLAAPVASASSSALVRSERGRSPSPAPPSGPQLQNRRPRSGSSSPAPHVLRPQGTVLPIGRISGAPREAARLEFPATPKSLIQASSPRPPLANRPRDASLDARGGGPSDEGASLVWRQGSRAPETLASGQSPRDNSVPCFGKESPEFHMAPVSDGATGGSPSWTQPTSGYGGVLQSTFQNKDVGFGWPDSLHDLVPGAACEPMKPAQPPPLYEWPFEFNAMTDAPSGCEFSAPSPRAPFLGLVPFTPRGSEFKSLPDVRPPRRPSASGRPGSAEKGGVGGSAEKGRYGGMNPLAAVGSYSAGISLGMPAAPTGPRSARVAPPLLPPVTPRNRAG